MSSEMQKRKPQCPWNLYYFLEVVKRAYICLWETTKYIFCSFQDKNPFSVMSEEDLSQIDAVLSTEEGKLILQQTGASAFKMDDIEEGPFNAMSG